MYRLLLSLVFLAITLSSFSQIVIQRDTRDHQQGVFVGMEFVPKIMQEKDGYAFANNVFLRLDFIDFYRGLGLYVDFKGFFKQRFEQQQDLYKDDLFYQPAARPNIVQYHTTSRSFGLNYQFFEFVHVNAGITVVRYNSGYKQTYVSDRIENRVTEVEYGSFERKIAPEVGLAITPTRFLKIGSNYNFAYKALTINFGIGIYLSVDGRSKIGLNQGGLGGPKRVRSGGARYFGL